MGETKIEWADFTLNPWIGCTKVSNGCKQCYAEATMDKRWKKAEWGPRGQRVRTSEANWRKPLAWDRKAKREGVRYRVFCASLADVFEGPETMTAGSWAVVRQARADLMSLVAETTNLDWLLLTKRPRLVMDLLRDCYDLIPTENGCEMVAQWLDGNTPGGIWIGTSVEDQAAADERIPHLLSIPASVRFLSMEPLLGPVDLESIPQGVHGLAETVLSPECWGDCACGPDPGCFRNGGDGRLRGVDWVIVGCESNGKRAGRPMEMEWARSLKDQCVDAEVPFFLKQAGEDGLIKHLPELDGRTWDQVPEVRA